MSLQAAVYLLILNLGHSHLSRLLQIGTLPLTAKDIVNDDS